MRLITRPCASVCGSSSARSEPGDFAILAFSLCPGRGCVPSLRHRGSSRVWFLVLGFPTRTAFPELQALRGLLAAHHPAATPAPQVAAHHLCSGTRGLAVPPGPDQTGTTTAASTVLAFSFLRERAGRFWTWQESSLTGALFHASGLALLVQCMSLVRLLAFIKTASADPGVAVAVGALVQDGLVGSTRSDRRPVASLHPHSLHHPRGGTRGLAVPPGPDQRSVPRRPAHPSNHSALPSLGAGGQPIRAGNQKSGPTLTSPPS